MIQIWSEVEIVAYYLSFTQVDHQCIYSTRKNIHWASVQEYFFRQLSLETMFWSELRIIKKQLKRKIFRKWILLELAAASTDEGENI